MKLALPLALGLLAFAVLPLLAHALRRGATTKEVFPGARFVQPVMATSRQRRHIQDRALLAARMLLVLALAVLAASPLAHCSRLQIARPQGGSVAVGLLLDDSASMNAEVDGRRKWDRALAAARALVQSAQDGDAFVVVLAGFPARLLLSSTTNKEAVLSALNNLAVSERKTDLSGAVTLAQSLLGGLPQPSKQLLLLSDSADPVFQGIPPGAAALKTPLPELLKPFENCAIVSAMFHGSQVLADVECTSESASSGRTVGLFRGTNESGSPQADGTSLAEAPVGRSTIRLTAKDAALSPGQERYVVQLSSDSSDQLPSDDILDVAPPLEPPAIGVVTDAARSGVETSESSVLELSLEAVSDRIKVRRLTTPPQTIDELRPLAGLILDDPAGLTPEAQSSLEDWLNSGGVALGLMGQHAASAPLSRGFWPLLASAPALLPFAPGQGNVPAPESSVLLPLGEGYDHLNASRRADLPLPDGVQSLLRWKDGAPFLAERRVGRGAALVAGLPASLTLSDLTLRPGFLAWMRYLVEQIEARSVSGQSLPGSSWTVPAGTVASGPAGVLEVHSDPARGQVVTPEVSGLYEFRRDGAVTVRHVARQPGEHVEQPTAPGETEGGSVGQEPASWSPISREVALLVLAVFALELVLRARRLRSAQSVAIGDSA